MQGITILENLYLVVLVGNIAITILSYILGSRRGYRKGYIDGVFAVSDEGLEMEWCNRNVPWEAGKYEHG